MVLPDPALDQLYPQYQGSDRAYWVITDVRELSWVAAVLHRCKVQMVPCANCKKCTFCTGSAVKGSAAA